MTRWDDTKDPPCSAAGPHRRCAPHFEPNGPESSNGTRPSMPNARRPTPACTGALSERASCPILADLARRSAGQAGARTLVHGNTASDTYTPAHPKLKHEPNPQAKARDARGYAYVYAQAHDSPTLGAHPFPSTRAHKHPNARTRTPQAKRARTPTRTQSTRRTHAARTPAPHGPRNPKKAEENKHLCPYAHTPQPETSKERISAPKDKDTHVRRVNARRRPRGGVLVHVYVTKKALTQARAYPADAATCARARAPRTLVAYPALLEHAY
ncbi:hypothetical protein B0H13DRAFT_1874514 [Mycena leptocephala]|nr:hypothetical protein B0H13DRAFT_1874514 [Mycena leptocephala]